MQNAWADLERASQTLTDEKPTTMAQCHHPLVCRECGGAKVVTPEGMPTCTECGLVDMQMIDESKEWNNNFGEDGRSAFAQDPTRCGTLTADTELFSPAWGQNTVIATRYGSSHQVKRMAKISFHQSMNHRDRALYHAYKEIEEVCHLLPENIVREAKVIWKTFNERKLTRGVVRKGIKANCVLYACARAKVSRSKKEVADLFKIQSGDVSRTAEMFKKVMFSKIGPRKNIGDHVTTKPKDVVVRLLNDFDVTREDRFKIMKICYETERCVELMSKTPKAVAACVIYTVLNKSMGVMKTEITSICDVSLPTLNKIECTLRNKVLRDECKI